MLRPDLWDLATRELAICKGNDEWRRLRRYDRHDLKLAQISADDEPRFIRIPRDAELHVIGQYRRDLDGDLSRLAAASFMAGICRRMEDLAEKVSRNCAYRRNHGSGRRYGIRIAKIIETLDQLAGLDAWKIEVALSDFSHTFQHWLERSSLIGGPAQIAMA